MTVAPESGSILALVGHHEQHPMVHTSHRHGIGSPCSRGWRHPSPSHHHRSIRARRTRGIHPQETTAPQESVDQIFLRSFQPFFVGLEKTIMNIKVKRRYIPRKPRACGRRTRQKKQRRASLTQVTNMTTTWSNPGASTRPPARQFDSDSHDLMLDDGASACITNCKEDFVEPPKRVDRKVKGIKGHADATHRGTIKWYLEDDAGLVSYRELTLFPMRRLEYCRHNTSHNKRTITIPRKKVLDR